MAGTPTKTKFTLLNGSEMPAVGLGTFRIRSENAVFKVVDDALAAGYRLFDTAAVYHNEAFLGKAFHTLLPKYGLDREHIFVTTKLSPADLGNSGSIERAFETSVEKLGLDYIDLYLIHFPGAQKIPASDKRNSELRLNTWEAMVKLYDEGRANAIGVSNFTIKHLEDLMVCCQGVKPMVNQVEWHPYYHQYELLQFCKANEIVLQAYSSFGGMSVSNDSLMTHPVVTKIAKKFGVTSAQVLLAWALQNDVAVIPKSTNPEHLKQNICLNFKLSHDDMKILNALGTYKTKYAWDPVNVA